MTTLDKYSQFVLGLESLSSLTGASFPPYNIIKIDIERFNHIVNTNNLAFIKDRFYEKICGVKMLKHFNFSLAFFYKFPL